MAIQEASAWLLANAYKAYKSLLVCVCVFTPMEPAQVFWYAQCSTAFGLFFLVPFSFIAIG